MNFLFLIGRVIFGGYFLINGISHFKNKASLLAYSKSKGIKKGDTAVISTGILLFLGGLGIILGTFMQVAMMFLIIFLIPTSFKMHAFWKETDPTKKMNEQIAFMKNMALVGALIMMFTNLVGPWPMAL